MNIEFQPGRNLTNDNRISDRRTDAVSGTMSPSPNNKLDISKKDKDIGVFGTGELTSFDDFVAKVSTKNVSLESDALAVMSNCMSAEDFARFQEEGYSPSNMEVDELVTGLDKIKAVLVKSGVDIKGFTDDLSLEQIEEITGNKGYAAAIENALNDNFLPADRENIEKVDSVIKASENIEKPNDAAVSYMINNELSPTVDNIYMANHSSLANTTGNAASYYRQENGYIGRNATDYDIAELRPQMENIIKDAGLTVNDDTLKQAEWLVENNIPLTKENLINLQNINSIQFPVAPEVCANSAAAALADGIDVKYADLTKTESSVKKAVDLRNDVLGRLDEYEKKLSDYESGKNKDILKDIPDSEREAFNPVKERRLLEETRLLMTSQASISFLKKGVEIDTKDLQSLVDKLREEEKLYYEPLLIEHDNKDLNDSGNLKLESELSLKLDLFKRTSSIADEIKSAPAELIAKLYTGEISTLEQTGNAARSLKADYERANKTYEEVGTAPRADMGDSIKKAFRNVDDILEDMELEVNAVNEKAVRILGYSGMEITEENIDGVSRAETAVMNVLTHMTPARTLKMIRDGENPLDVDMYELSEKLMNEDEEISYDKYSEFLFKLDKAGEITENEKEAFIGMFRLFKKIERSDEKLIGKVIKADDRLTLNNILKASRSERAKGMDVTVDESFGALEKLVSYGKSITDQIMSGFKNDSSDNEAYAKAEAEEIRQAVNVEKEVIDALESADAKVTPANISAMEALMNTRGSAISRLFDREKSDERKEAIKQEIENLKDSFTSEEDVNKGYENFNEKMQEIVKESIENADNYIDIKQMRSINKQLSIISGMARNHSYEVPVMINGTMTSINLKLVKDSGESGKVTATFETESTGKVSAEFKLSDGQVNGFIATENTDFSDEMKRKEPAFRAEFEKAGFPVTNIGYASSKNIEIKGAYLSADNSSAPAAKQLYTLAKAIISSISE